MGKNDTHLDFSGWDAFCDYVSSDIPTKSHNMDSHNGSEEFCKSATYDEALGLARGGWGDGAKMIAEMRAKILAVTPAVVPVMQEMYAVSGSMVDIGRYLDGCPECMVDFQMHDKPDSPVVSIGVNVSISGYVSADAIIRRGAAIAAVVDSLEAGGRRCELDVCFISRAKNTISMRVRVKDADQPVDIERMAFALAHPSMLRRLVLLMIEKQPDCETRFRAGCGYGAPTEYTRDSYDMSMLERMTSDGHFTSDKNTADWVRGQLEKQGVEFIED